MSLRAILQKWARREWEGATMEMEEGHKPNPENKVPDRQVTIRLEDKTVQDFEEAEFGGGPPALPVPPGALQKVGDTCWPCVLMGVGIILIAAAAIWYELSPKQRG